jgi:arginase
LTRAAYATIGTVWTVPHSLAAVGSWDLLVSPWHLEEPIERFPAPAGAVVLPASTDEAQSELGRLSARYRAVADRTARADRPLVLAGDCLTAVGILAGVQRQRGNLSIIWLDAHGDFNTPEISVSGYLAGMSLAAATGRVPQLGEPLGLRAVPDDRCLLIGARDLDPAEADALAASRVTRVAADPDELRAALQEQSPMDVYLHIDVDIVDGSDLAGLRFPAPDGPTLSVVEDCLTQIVECAPPAAACIACAWEPARIADPSTLRAIGRLAAVIGADVRWP